MLSCGNITCQVYVTIWRRSRSLINSLVDKSKSTNPELGCLKAVPPIVLSTLAHFEYSLKPYTQSISGLEASGKVIDIPIAMGVVQRSKATAASPAFLTKKKDGDKY